MSLGPNLFRTCESLPECDIDNNVINVALLLILQLSCYVGLHIPKRARGIQIGPGLSTLLTAKRISWADKTTGISDIDSMHAAIQLLTQVGLKSPLLQAVYGFPTVPWARISKKCLLFQDLMSWC